jgi:DNA-binding NarL/FixJ family response regulator
VGLARPDPGGEGFDAVDDCLEADRVEQVDECWAPGSTDARHRRRRFGLFRDGVTRILTESDIDVSGQARDGDELVRMVRDDPPDAVVVDIRMPPTGTDEGLIAARSIRREHPDVGVLVLSTFIDTAFAFELATELPERMGYLLKDRVADGNELIDAIRRIDADWIALSSSYGTLKPRTVSAGAPRGI